MLALKKIIYCLLFITTVASAQVKKIQFVSDENKSPLSDVEVYDGNVLLGKSNPNGYLEIKTGDYNELRIIKGDYRDSVIKVADLQEKMTLSKIKPIELKEVVIGKEVSVRKILNYIQDNLDHCISCGEKRIYGLPDYYNVTNKLLMETDTLHYLNGLIKYEPNKGTSIDKNFRLVKNFRKESIQSDYIYYINKKVLTLSTGWSYGDDLHIDYLHIPYYVDTDNVLKWNILEKKRNYHYTVTNIGDFYKVEFVSKNKSPFGFNGYLIVDKTDFGIYEFKAHMSDNIKNNDKSTLKGILSHSLKQIYHVAAIDYYAKLQKDKNGIYQLLCSYSDKQFEQTQGNFKGKKFSYSSKVEATDNYKTAEFKSFDMYRYELK